jgi:rSAM/selenodomain-associated transferase 2
MEKLSIIVPVLDEAAEIVDALTALAPLRARGAEVIVVDGGSRDRTLELAAPLCDRVITAPRGRAAQMNAGARLARGAILLFLHADTRLPERADALALQAVHDSGRVWGRFDVTIAGRHRLLPLVAWLMNWRSRITGICTGDQALLMTREAFAGVNGFPDIALMEDVAISAALKRLSRPACIKARVTTSGRRWEARGVMRTVLLMWRLRVAFFFGARPDALAQRYGYVPRRS